MTSERRSTSHLAGCSACRHRVAGFAADQTAIARLPRYVLGPAAATAVRGRITRRSSTPRPTLRLLAAAAMLALLALAALAVGAQMIRRDRDLTEVAPDDRAEPRGAGPAGRRPGRRFDGGCRRLRAPGAHRADGGRFEVGKARTAPQPWRPAPDPPGTGQRGRLRLVPGPGHRLAASRLGRRGRSRRRRLDRGSEHLVGRAGDLHRRRGRARFGASEGRRDRLRPTARQAPAASDRRASNAGSTARS